eukprot:m.90606 g.90606  ORF g.90606 m.90606 type:complete len:345 (+) comp15272_c0_seq2:409-1443(+)
MSSATAWDRHGVAERAGLMNIRLEEEDDELEDDYFPPNFNPRKRKSVCAEVVDSASLNDDVSFHPKTMEQYSMLQGVVQRLFLFRSLEAFERKIVIDAMFRREVAQDEVVIVQGADGDNFYVVESGIYEAFVHEKLVATYNNSGSFGELALMYNCPRAATIKCKSSGILWALDRRVFRQVLLKHAMEKRALYESFLESIPVLTYLTKNERSRLVDALEPVYFADGERIIRQGDPAKAFFFVVSGSVEVKVSKKLENGKTAEVKLVDLHKGAYFGELALLTNRPRAAHVDARGSVTCARLSTDSFERLLGPCMSAMKDKIAVYEEQMNNALGPSSSSTGSHFADS